MNIFKKVSIVTCATLLAGAIALTACKDNNEDKHAKEMTALGKEAALEFCDCWGKHDNLMAQLENCAGGLYVKYGAYIEDEHFYAAFGDEIPICQSSVDWDAIFCLLGFAECSQTTGAKLAKAQEAATGLCDCWGKSEGEPMLQLACGEGLQQYQADFADDFFMAAFGIALQACNPKEDWQQVFQMLGFF